MDSKLHVCMQTIQILAARVETLALKKLTDKMGKVQSITIIVVILQFFSSARSSKVEFDPPNLLEDMEAHDQVTVMVSFNDSSTLSRIRKATTKSSWWAESDRSARLSGMRNALKAHADQVQRPILSMLNQVQLSKLGGDSRMQVHQLWASNKIVVKHAPKSVLEQLLDFPQVAKIQKDRVYKQNKPILSNTTTMRKGNVSKQLPTPLNPLTAPDGSSRNWGANIIGVQRLWRKEITGHGTSVVIVDTGVSPSHEALNASNFLLWHDYVEGKSTPVDPAGHGTHCAGNVAGIPEVGIAPGALWSACRGCGVDGCPQSALELCCQWSACPDGLPCAKAPDVVSNSWGATDILGVGGLVENWMEPYFELLKAGDIFPAVAVGNSDPGTTCARAAYPDNSLQVFAVGSTDSDDKVSDYSCTGQPLSTMYTGRTKPDVAAPGRNIFGAWISNSNSYISISGTSMATPIIAGLALLIRCACPVLSREQILSVMCKGAIQLTGSCDPFGSIFGGANNDAGCGRPDALKIFNVLCSMSECDSLKRLCQSQP